MWHQLSLYHARIQYEGATCKPGIESPPEPARPGTLISDCCAPELEEKKFSCLCHPDSGILSWQPKLTEIDDLMDMTQI